MTYSSEDFERFYLRYKAEAMPLGMSIQAFCSKNKVPHNLFNKWYSDTRHRLVPVQVNGMPQQEIRLKENSSESDAIAKPVHSDSQKEHPIRIMIDLKMTNGMHIQQRNLSYDALKRLISNLEVLC